MIEEVDLVGYCCTAGRHDASKTDSLDNHTHGVEPEQLLIKTHTPQYVLHLTMMNNYY